MLEHIMHFQVGYYAPGTQLDPSPDIIAILLDCFRDKGLVPTTVTEFDISGNLRTRLQLQFISPDESWMLAFESKRLMLRKQSVPDVEIGSREQFNQDASDILMKLLSAFPLPGNRLSYGIRGLFHEVPEVKLLDVHQKVMNALPYYIGNPPIQWTTRNVSRSDESIGEKTETLNIITDINRSQGEFKRQNHESDPFDRIEVGLDINTYQDNTDFRFSGDDIGPFLKKALEIASQLIDEAGELLDE